MTPCGFELEIDGGTVSRSSNQVLTKSRRFDRAQPPNRCRAVSPSLGRDSHDHGFFLSLSPSCGSSQVVGLCLCLCFGRVSKAHCCRPSKASLLHADPFHEEVRVHVPVLVSNACFHNEIARACCDTK